MKVLNVVMLMAMAIGALAAPMPNGSDAPAKPAPIPTEADDNVPTKSAPTQVADDDSTKTAPTEVYEQSPYFDVGYFVNTIANDKTVTYTDPAIMVKDNRKNVTIFNNNWYYDNKIGAHVYNSTTHCMFRETEEIAAVVAFDNNRKVIGFKQTQGFNYDHLKYLSACKGVSIDKIKDITGNAHEITINIYQAIKLMFAPQMKNYAFNFYKKDDRSYISYSSIDGANNGKIDDYTRYDICLPNVEYFYEVPKNEKPPIYVTVGDKRYSFNITMEGENAKIDTINGFNERPIGYGVTCISNQAFTTYVTNKMKAYTGKSTKLSLGQIIDLHKPKVEKPKGDTKG